MHGRRILPVTGLTAHPLLRFWARALSLALVVHVGLPDYDEPGWGGPRALKLAAAAILLVRPHALGFALCLGTSLYTLLALRDVLTQQLLLACLSGAGLVAALAGTRSSGRAALQVAAVAAAGTYLLAALHKLNTDFFDPAVSCAQHAWTQVETFWFAWAALPGPPGVWLPAAIVGIELVFVALLLRGSPWIWPLGIAFHLPLTVTLAPAFGAVMLVGYAAAMGPRTVVRWRRTFRRHKRLLALAAALALGLDAAAHGGLGPWDGRLKVAAAGTLFAWAVLAGLRRERLRLGRASFAFGAVYLLHGLLPYTGLKVQHAGAMLSNLRIDPACHNSLIFPATLRMRDPYVYVDEAHIGQGQRPARERVLRETLWSIAALHAARENWCIAELRPIVLRGHWRGEPFTLPDLCAEDFVEHLPDAGLPGASFFPWYQALQKNLPRACHAACVH